VHARVRKAFWSLALASGLGLAGCLEVPASLNPVFPPDRAVSPDEIEGSWREPGGDTGLRIRAGGGGSYELVVFDTDRPSAAAEEAFELRFAHLGGELFWDLTAAPAQEGLGRRRVHVPARVRLGDGQLEVAFLDPEALRGALDRGEVALGHALADEVVVLTGAPGELASFLEEHGGNEALFDEPVRFVRARAPRR
jgi:hypothetical protein